MKRETFIINLADYKLKTSKQNKILFIYLFFLIVGSPVWKPRDMNSLGDAQSTARKDESK